MRTVITRYRWWSVGVALVALCMMGSAFIALQPAKAQVEEQPRLFCPGPMGLTRGQTSRHIFHLHDDQRVREAACHLTIEDAQGNPLVDTEFTLTADRSVTVDLSVLDDGRVFFNGRRVRANVVHGNPLEIIPCIRVFNLPRSVALFATAQGVNNQGGDPHVGDPHVQVGLGRTAYILSYKEL